VNAAVDEVAAGSTDARVSSFIGVLVGSARSGNSGSLCGPPTSGMPAAAGPMLRRTSTSSAVMPGIVEAALDVVERIEHHGSAP